MERMAVALGRPDAATLSEFFQDLIVDVGLPVTLSEIGLEKSDFKGIAAAALRDHSTECNPRKMTEADCEQLLHDAL
jgi:alcohol dehydrogenase class IV